MNELKEKIPVAIGIILFIVLCGVAFYFVLIRSVYYYTQIDNEYATKTSVNEYEYKLRAYNEHGQIQDVDFKANKELREDAFLRLESNAVRGVINWEEVTYDELPQDVKSRYQQ